MRNIETFPSKQMYPYLSLDERKVAEFYHNIDRRRWLVWLKWLIFINFSGQLMVSLGDDPLQSRTIWCTNVGWKHYHQLGLYHWDHHVTTICRLNNIIVLVSCPWRSVQNTSKHSLMGWCIWEWFCTQFFKLIHHSGTLTTIDCFTSKVTQEIFSHCKING